MMRKVLAVLSCIPFLDFFAKVSAGISGVVNKGRTPVETYWPVHDDFASYTHRV